MTAPSRSRRGFEVGCQPTRCSSVGAEKVDSNHSATAGWKLDKDIKAALGNELIIPWEGMEGLSRKRSG